ncbi:sarcolemmal membrane-associated protein [Fusarium flagelliforme]|uniref:Sarcolemmal membrane-associated protein n=1 Tax=Fusarium flagelliforme TaxID=2675880 RepID=A0A395M934_9HYPO|nr:sarcolemmal membrane-associated protein [Fusarium flagelliforme]
MFTVLITLKSVNPPPDFAFKERRIFLTRQNPTMKIGRTSKKKSSLEATKCNAWFDSPVMSREHAAFRFDAKNQKVYIEDTKSLHGTYKNGVLLEKEATAEISSGDKLMFGIPIMRGMESYPPTTLETILKYGSIDPASRGNCFRVPDESDVEEAMSSDDDQVSNSCKMLYSKNVRPAPFLGPSSSRSPIDLTCEDQAPLSDVRDDILPVSASAEPSLFVVDDPEHDSCIEDEMEDEYEIQDDSSVHDSDNQDEAMENEWFEEHDEFEEEEEGIFADFNFMAHSDPFPGETDLADSTMLNDGTEETSAEPNSVGNTSTSEAQNADSDISEQPKMDTHVSSQTSNCSGSINKVDPTKTWSANNNLWNVDLPPMELPPIREPVQLPAITDWTNPQLFTGQTTKNAAQAMGLKTGKEAFFAAREINKINAKVTLTPTRPEYSRDIQSNIPDPSNVADLLSRKVADVVSRKVQENAHEKVQEKVQETAHEKVQVPVDQLAPDLATSGTLFLNTPRPSDLATSSSLFVSSPDQVPFQSSGAGTEPVLDETSAFSFEMSKKASGIAEPIGDTIDQATSAEKSNKEGSSISADAAQAPPEANGVQEPRKAKRKADDISKLTHQEQRWESNGGMTPPPAPSHPHKRASDIILREKESAVPPPPAKRLRKMAEVVGYAALGGVAVMSALIATAPTL